MITKDKITEIFCILDEFSKNFDAEMQNHSLPTGFQKPRKRRKASLSDSEIMTILLVFHFGSFANFKHYYYSLAMNIFQFFLLLFRSPVVFAELHH